MDRHELLAEGEDQGQDFSSVLIPQPAPERRPASGVLSLLCGCALGLAALALLGGVSRPSPLRKATSGPQRLGAASALYDIDISKPPDFPSTLLPQQVASVTQLVPSPSAPSLPGTVAAPVVTKVSRLVLDPLATPVVWDPATEAAPRMPASAQAPTQTESTTNAQGVQNMSAGSSAKFVLVDESRESASSGGSGSRRGSFLVLGDWGFDEDLHGNVNDTGCQRAIADRMLEKFEELGDVQFIINVGDSFYPQGLKGPDDPQWDTKWRNIYHEKLRSVPWYSVYGNHDYHHDPCACSPDPNDCAQVNWDVNNLTRFYMPGYNWYREHPDLNLEVVGLDLNKFMDGWNMTAKADELNFADCQWTPCKAECIGNMNARAEQAFDLFADRYENSDAKNLLVFSHYPTDYFSSRQDFLRNLSNNSNHDIIFFGGHRHNVDNTTTWGTAPNRNWVVGGGGGWSCDGPSQGFLVGTVGLDDWVETTPVLVDYSVCCPR